MPMKYPVAILAVAAVALAACDRPATNTAYNNSGSNAATTPASNPPERSRATGDMDNSSATAPAGDETGMSRRIMTAIATDPAMKDADVTVKTENGVVTLGGTAKSQDQVALATGIATKQDGVARVESQIALR